MCYLCDILYTVVCVRVNCVIVRGCAVSRRYIHVCNSDVFSAVNMYLDHLKFCIVCIRAHLFVNFALYCVVMCRVVFHCAVLYYDVFYYIVVCCVVLCCTVMRCVFMCRAVLWCAMLYCDLSCSVVLPYFVIVLVRVVLSCIV